MMEVVLNMSRVIVTGGAGFIGSALADGLVARGYQVVIIDNLATGRVANIQHLLGNKKIEFVRGSVTSLPMLQELFSGAKYVFHQAAISSVPRSIKNPKLSHNINTTGTLNVLLAARDNGIEKVIYASSSSVYGDSPTLPKTEDMTPNPLSPYAVTKLTGEYYCLAFQGVYSLDTVCLRYFNVYGPRQDPNSQYAAVIPKFITSILAGKPPVIFGDGEQSRDFTFVRDVVEANILAAESRATGVFNIGRSERVTLNHLAQLIIGLAGDTAIRPVHAEPRPGDIKHSLADITRARAFGYNPGYSLEQGLKETLRTFGQS
jgi:UDP-glucose 4-epimerase